MRFRQARVGRRRGVLTKLYELAGQRLGRLARWRQPLLQRVGAHHRGISLLTVGVRDLELRIGKHLHHRNSSPQWTPGNALEAPAGPPSLPRAPALAAQLPPVAKPMEIADS